jgi:hypothetical protein
MNRPGAADIAGAGAVWAGPALVAHAGDLLRSFRSVTGRELLPASGDAAADARALFEAPFVVLSHGLEDDPVLNYGNAAALALWETNFEALTRMPSRLTAEPMLREERARLLETAARQGYIDHYAGVRISASGKRFHIEQAIIWNVVDPAGAPRGQAATFARWTPL